MTKTCFDCDKALAWTGPGPGCLNREQWDATKAGDFYVKCDEASHPNGNCYFRDTDGVPVLKRIGASNDHE